MRGWAASSNVQLVLLATRGAGENNVNGFGLEFYIETPADEIGTSLNDIKKSWQFQLLFTVSQLAAGAQEGWFMGCFDGWLVWCCDAASRGAAERLLAAWPKWSMPLTEVNPPNPAFDGHAGISNTIGNTCREC